MSQKTKCPKCGELFNNKRYFCGKCGSLLNGSIFSDDSVYGDYELRIMRILENIAYTPHNSILWDDMVDVYVKKVEQYRAIMNLPEMKSGGNINDKMADFIEHCVKPEFQIAFVGTIKTGKSTLINALLGHNYASMAVTPETAALTKFRSSPRDYINVEFYSENEWKKLWASRTSGADAFMKEYNELNADAVKEKWVGHEPLHKELANDEIEDELSIWSSSKCPEHYFVKEIEVGISSLPKEFPSQVVFVDTPGLSDPVAYRSDITKDYIRQANAVFVCVDAHKVDKSEIETIASVFSFSSYNKNKVHIIATKFDNFNDPDVDWAQQKSWLKKRLVGKGFFDNVAMAEKNIIHSAAHIDNLCRDFETISDKEKKSLRKFAIAMDLDDDDLRSCIKFMREKSNIDYIRDIVNDELAGKYRDLLRQDIERKYLDIMYSLKRIAKEEQKDMSEIIEMTSADIEKIKEKVEKQKKDYEEIISRRQQLTAILKIVESNTQKRLDVILSQLNTRSGSGKKK